MIQRVQSIYLLLAALFSGGLIFVFPLWIQKGINISAWSLFSEPSYVSRSVLVMFLGAAILALYAIFSFKDRKKQFVIVRIIMLIHLFLLGILIYLLLSLPREETSEKGIGMFIPIFVVLFSVMANKAIKKDEDLVKSVDRLR